MKRRLVAVFFLAALLFSTVSGGLFRAASTEAAHKAGHSEKVKQENKKAGTTRWKSKELDEYAQKQWAERHKVVRTSKADDGGSQPSVSAQASSFNPGPISGYLDRASANVGEPVRLYVSTTRLSYRVELYRMGWYGGTGARLIASVGPLPGVSQPVPPPDPATGLVEPKWQPSHTFQTGADWVSGAYLVKLITDAGNVQYAWFALRDDADQADVVYAFAVARYQAYNEWGGKSLYDYNSTGGRAYKVSFERPYQQWSGGGDFFQGDYNMVRWLESQNYSVKYATSLDLHENAGLLSGGKMLLSNWHDEYWSMSMRTNVSAARDAGKHLAFFNSNNIFWQVRFEPSGTGRPNHTMVCYKDASLDPLASTNPTMATVKWRDAPVGMPENELLGVMYESAFAYGDSFPWVVQNSAHWMYAGTGLRDGDQIAGLVGYEYDKVFNNGRTPAGLHVLAASPVSSSKGASTHNATMYTAPSGAIVFAAGTNYWAWKLDDNDYQRHGVDARVQQMTVNLLNRMVGGPQPTPTPTSAPATRPYRDVVAGDRPLAYWRLGESGGTTLVDQNGQLNGSYLGSPSLGAAGALPGDVDTAVRFDGTSSYAAVPYRASLNGQTFSVELWAYPTGGAGLYRGLVASRSYPRGWVFYAGSDNRWQFWFNDGTGMASISAGSVPLNTWTHLVATFDGTTAWIYANGQLISSGTTASYGPNTSAPLAIGQGQPGNGFWFPGRIDELSYYGAVLSEAQVQAHYAAGLSSSSSSTTPTATRTPTAMTTAVPASPTATATSTPTAAPASPSATTTATATRTPSPTTTATATRTPSPTATVAAADFSLGVSPTSRSVKRGRSTTYRLTASPSGGFTGSLALAVDGLPPGATASFAPSTLSVSGAASSSTLTVDTANATPRGTYRLTITASGGGKTRTSQVTLIVT